MGFTEGWPLWIIFIAPIPLLLIFYLLAALIRHLTNPKPENQLQDLEIQYMDVDL
jgi:hypothetical protein